MKSRNMQREMVSKGCSTCSIAGMVPIIRHLALKKIIGQKFNHLVLSWLFLFLVPILFVHSVLSEATEILMLYSIGVLIFGIVDDGLRKERKNPDIKKCDDKNSSCWYSVSSSHADDNLSVRRKIPSCFFQS